MREFNPKIAPLLATFFCRMFQPLNLPFLKLEKNNFVCNLFIKISSYIFYLNMNDKPLILDVSYWK